ncbi:MAG: conjugative transposon protein TraM [Bacteroidales bacterium]|nr:conjugative transposon protein TraM [Bacteroidales bacterium]
MKTLDKRQKKLLAGILGVLALIAVLLLLPLLAPADDPSGESLVAVIPEADLPGGEDSKLGSYRKGGIGDYWDSLLEGEDGLGSTGMEPQGRDGGASRGRTRPEAMDVSDLFGDVKEAPPSETPPPKKSGSGARKPSGGKGQAAAAPAAHSALPAKPAEPVPAQESPEKEPPQRPQVKRSGAVSSLDEDVASDLGNGFSTLDGTDRWVGAESGKPYRCMFTRDEKVKSGQRITLRLLEDLVVSGVHIPRNTHLQGVVNVTDRMEIRVTALDIGGRILSFHFEAFDTDGGKGIYCSDLSQSGKTALEQGIATVSSTLSSGLGRVARDAASVGASIVRNKAGEATVTIPAGYTFYIIEQKR